MIGREIWLRRIRDALRAYPVVALLGPRQCGKTTLARMLARERPGAFFDLEDPADRASLEAPGLALRDLKGLVVLDEAQRKPELFEQLRVLADRVPRRARFLVLGSASPALVRGVSETLAGRVALLEMSGFDLGELGAGGLRRRWLRGSLPPSYLASSERRSFEWRTNYMSTFLERDIPQLGIAVPAQTLRRFWTMAAHYHGHVWNAAEFARSLGSAEATARRYLDILAGAFVVRPLAPWFENLKKRQLKAPKLYIRDSGLLHALLSLESERDVRRHPKYGASWEGLAIEEVLARYRPRDAYYWGTHAGAELDLLIFHKGKRLGFEMKCEDAPRLTKSMRVAWQDLGLDKLYVLYPGTKTYSLEKGIEALPLGTWANG